MLTRTNFANIAVINKTNTSWPRFYQLNKSIVVCFVVSFPGDGKMTTYIVDK